MESDELVDRKPRPFRRLEQVRTVVPRRDLDLTTIFDREATLGLREPHDFALGVAWRDAKRIEPHDDGCVRRHRATLAERVPRIRERTSAPRDRVIDVITELDEERAVAEGTDAWIAQARNGATFTLALPSASRTARAISGAPGVSPCTHRVSTASLRNVPSTAVTPPFFTNERA